MDSITEIETYRRIWEELSGIDTGDLTKAESRILSHVVARLEEMEGQDVIGREAEDLLCEIPR